MKISRVKERYNDKDDDEDDKDDYNNDKRYTLLTKVYIYLN